MYNFDVSSICWYTTNSQFFLYRTELGWMNTGSSNAKHCQNMKSNRFRVFNTFHQITTITKFGTGDFYPHLPGKRVSVSLILLHFGANLVFSCKEGETMVSHVKARQAAIVLKRLFICILYLAMWSAMPAKTTCRSSLHWVSSGGSIFGSKTKLLPGMTALTKTTSKIRICS